MSDSTQLDRTGQPGTRRHVEVFDTTLRDGLQVEGVSATVDDKLRIAEQLDLLGVHFIEGGWPGANPKDIEFFARARTELRLTTSTLVAFGSTRRPRGKVDDDATLRNLIDAGTSAVCIVAKSSEYQVVEALQTTLDEGAAMIADSVRFLRGEGRMVLVDLEHFFDGYKANPEFSLRAIEAAVVNGASHLVLCDTNGGTLPSEVGRIVSDITAHVGDDAIIGIHCHDDTGCAVANSMAAVRSRRRPRAGHAQRPRRADRQHATSRPSSRTCNSSSATQCLPEGRIERLTAVSHHVAETLNRAVNPQAPYVGSSAFAHKAGLHVSAIVRAKDAYEHVNPELVGNGTRFVVSEMAGRATIQMKADEIGIELDGAAINEVVDDLKRLEHEGYHFEAADASLELLMRRAAGQVPEFFRVEIDAGDHRRASRRRVHHRGHRQGVGRQRRRRRTPRVGRRGQRAGERHRRGAAQGGRHGAARTRRTSISPTTRSASSTAPARPDRRPASCCRPPTVSGTGRRSASAPTSSRRPGGRSRTAWSTGCSIVRSAVPPIGRVDRSGELIGPPQRRSTSVGC